MSPLDTLVHLITLALLHVFLTRGIPTQSIPPPPKIHHVCKGAREYLAIFAGVEEPEVEGDTRRGDTWMRES